MLRPLPLASLLILAPAALGQGALYFWPVRGAVDHAGDVDGDGLADIARTVPSVEGLGELHVHSGGTGVELLSDFGSAPGDGFGLAVCGSGDVDGDGRPDVVVAAYAYLRCVSGASGATLWQVASPTATDLASLGDLDGDGAREIVVGAAATAFGSVGQVLVRSGRTGVLLHTLAPPNATAGFGSSVASARDFDSDGAEDLLVGDPHGATGLGQVTVHSLAAGVQLAAFTGPVNPYTPTTAFGFAVASPGDVDGDGVSDVLVGAPADCIFPGSFEGCVSGRARLISGASGAVLHTFSQSTAFAGFGVAVSGFPDLDGDGLEDLLVSNNTHKFGCCIYQPAEVFVFSSASGATLYAGNGHGGQDVAVVPDLNGDGAAEYVSSPTTGWAKTLLALPFTQPSGSYLNCTPKLSSANCKSFLQFEGTASLSVGADLVVRAPDVRPSSVGMFLHGAQETTIPFAGGTLCIAPPIRRLAAGATGGTTTPCSGVLEQRFTKASLAALGYPPGSHFTIQAVYRDPGFAAPNNVGMSDALIISIWP